MNEHVLEAIRRGAVDEVRRALSHQDWTATTPDGHTALMVAMRTFRVAHEGSSLFDRLMQTVDLLVPLSDVNQGTTTHETPLMVAADNNNLALVQRLLDAGADPTRQDAHGFTALRHALGMNQPNADRQDLIRRLIPLTPVGRLDREGNSDLIAASSMNSASSIALLLPTSDLNHQRPEDGRNALMVACYWGARNSASALIKAPGIDLDQTDARGRTAAMIAKANGYDDMAAAIQNSDAYRVRQETKALRHVVPSPTVHPLAGPVERPRL